MSGRFPHTDEGLDRRRFLQAGAVGAFALAAAGGLAACGGDSTSSTGSSGGEHVTFGFSHPYSDVPLVSIIKQLVEQNASAQGWKTLLDETQAGDVQDQASTLDTWITQKLTAICAFPTDPSALEALAKRAVDAGVMWTTYGVRMETAAGGILFPPELSGGIVARATVEWIKANKPDAQVLILNSPADVATKARTEIPEREIKAKTNATIVGVQAGVEQTQGLRVTEDMLQAHPDLSVVVSNNDSGALGAAQAFRNAGKDSAGVYIIGQDGSKDALVEIKRAGSFLKATAALDIRRLCEEVVGVTQRALQRRWKPGGKQEWIELAPTLLTREDGRTLDRFLSTYQ
jgi:ABC-type sugar transport system substrate-binding protein